MVILPVVYIELLIRRVTQHQRYVHHSLDNCCSRKDILELNVVDLMSMHEKISEGLTRVTYVTRTWWCEFLTALVNGRTVVLCTVWCFLYKPPIATRWLQTICFSNISHYQYANLASMESSIDYTALRVYPTPSRGNYLSLGTSPAKVGRD